MIRQRRPARLQRPGDDLLGSQSKAEEQVIPTLLIRASKSLCLPERSAWVLPAWCGRPQLLRANRRSCDPTKSGQWSLPAKGRIVSDHRGTHTRVVGTIVQIISVSPIWIRPPGFSGIPPAPSRRCKAYRWPEPRSCRKYSRPRDGLCMDP